ncbi:hypothetical protein Pelo_10782 [Pelomyxa schiedti]|nr:hypothetical protein Pelo_10782 [Pelomyxa schiedti]
MKISFSGTKSVRKSFGFCPESVEASSNALLTSLKRMARTSSTTFIPCALEILRMAKKRRFVRRPRFPVERSEMYLTIDSTSRESLDWFPFTKTSVASANHTAYTAKRLSCRSALSV